MRKLFPLLTVSVLASSPLAAQTLMPEPFGNSEVGIEFLHPILDDGDEVDALSFASFIYTRIPVGRVHVVADLPWARIDSDLDSSTGLGNIMLGLEGHAGRATLYGQLRLPTASDDEFANAYALFSELPRPEVWVPDATSFAIGAIMRDRRAGGKGFDFQFGTSFFNPDEGDMEVVLDYGAQFVYRPRALGASIGLQGRAFVTADGGDFGERTFHDFRLRVDYTSGRIRPAIGVTLPFDDDLQEVLDAVLRLGVQVAL